MIVICDVICVFVYGTGCAEKSVDQLSFETLVPKPIMQRYASLLLEHRRVMLCGPSGTGKTYLAQRLAEFLVLRFTVSLLLLFVYYFYKTNTLVMNF